MCINFIHKWRLKSTPSDRFFEKLFHGSFNTLTVFATNLRRGNRRKNNFFLYFVWCLAWGSNPGFTSNKPTHYLVDCGDFMYLYEMWGMIVMQEQPRTTIKGWRRQWSIFLSQRHLQGHHCPQQVSLVLNWMDWENIILFYKNS